MNSPSIGSIDNVFDDDVSTTVVQRVAARAGVDATALPPLYESIDPDALDAIFASTGAGAPRTGRVEFEYAGYRVVVSSDEGVSITQARATARAERTASTSS